MLNSPVKFAQRRMIFHPLEQGADSDWHNGYFIGVLSRPA